MTNAKTDSKMRGLEQTFVNIAKRLDSGQDSKEKRDALSSTLGQVLQVMTFTNWRSATIYRFATAFTLAADETARRAATHGLVETPDAGLSEMAPDSDLLKLVTGLMRLLRAAKFKVREIAELIDDGGGGTAEQRQDRVKSRLFGAAKVPLVGFWKTALVKGKEGPSNPR